MADFSLKKIDSLGQTLTAKEAIKIVIEYALQEEKEGKDFDKEKSTIINALPSSYAREYNFYSSLAHSLKYVALDLQTTYLDLRIKAAHHSKIHYVLMVGAFAEKAQRLLRISPIMLSLFEYQQKLEEEKQKRLQGIMAIEELAKSETYLSLLGKSNISKDDYPDQESLYDAIANLGKTREEIVEEGYKSLGDFERRKIARDSGRKPEDVTDEEVKAYIAEHTNLLDKATPELKKIYEDELASQTKRLQKLVTDGVLQTGKEKDDEGIIVESVYKNIHLFLDQWIKRYIDDFGTYEIGEEEENGSFHRYAASVDSFYEKSANGKSFYDIETSFTKDLLETIQMLTPTSDKISLDQKVFAFEHEKHEEVVKQALKNTQELNRQLYTHLEVIKRIEKNFFDGIEVVSRKGLLTDVFVEAKEIIKDHNKSMQNVLDLYQEQYWSNCSIQGFDTLLLTESTEFDEKQLEQTCQELVDIASEHSKYKP